MVSSKLISEQGKDLISDSHYDFIGGLLWTWIDKVLWKKDSREGNEMLDIHKKNASHSVSFVFTLALIILYKNSKTEFYQKIRRNSEHFEVRKFKNKA